MPGIINCIIETEDAAAKYEEKTYYKCFGWQYMLNHAVKFYDLGLLKFLADALGWEMTLPPLASDFGKHTEAFDLSFIISEDSIALAEERLQNLIKFVRFKSAFAGQCFLYIGANIKEDGTRLLGNVGKGIEGKIANISAIHNSKTGYITGKLKFLQCIDLLNW